MSQSQTQNCVRTGFEVQKTFESEDSDSPDDEVGSLAGDSNYEDEYGSSHNSEEDAENISNYDESSEDEETKPPKKKRKILSLHGKNNYMWSIEASELRSDHFPIVKDHEPSALDGAQNVLSPLEAWSLLFTDKILNKIVRYTNQRLAKERKKSKHPDIPAKKNTDLIELKSIIGLCYYGGLLNCRKIDVKQLWSLHSPTIFRSSMTMSRFSFLLASIRFDNSSNRQKFSRSDIFSPIREIWELFIDNCRNKFKPGQDCSIGEEFLEFRGKCPFRMYVPSELDKYGMKIVSMNDAATSYTVNAIPYIRKMDRNLLEAGEGKTSYLIRKISEPIYHSHRNITCNNRFTSVPVVENMKNKFSLTMVGTIRKNKREIPESFKKISRKNKIRFAYNDDKTLVSYNTKRNKIVLLLSSLHYKGSVDEVTNEPEILIYYKKIMNRVEKLKRRCHVYSTARKTHRWPLRVFYWMLDQASVNSQILYLLNKNNPSRNHSQYLEELGYQLMEPYLRRRLLETHIPVISRYFIDSFLKEKNITEEKDSRVCVPDNNILEKKTRCSFCPISLDRKTRYKCLKCLMPMCLEHTAKMCSPCTQPELL